MADFIRANNEHLIPIQLFINLLDFTYFGARNLFSLGITALLQLTIVFVVVHAVSSAIDDWSFEERSLFTMFALLMALNPMQAENLTWAFQVAFVGSFALGTLAIASCAALGSDRLLYALLAACCVCALAFLSTLSLASGILVWPVLIAYCWLARFGWKAYIAIFVGFSLTLAFLSLAGAGSSTSEAIANALADPLGVFAWYLALLGNPFSALPMLFRQFLGFLVLVAITYLLVRSILDRFSGKPIDRSRLVTSMVSVFLAAACLSIAMGRYKAGLDYASTGRYMTPTMILWLFVIASILISTAARLRPVLLRMGASALVYVALLGPTLEFASNNGNLQPLLSGSKRWLPIRRTCSLKGCCRVFIISTLPWWLPGLITCGRISFRFFPTQLV
ncbi:hypothetical protein ACFL33_02035 [Pseudomonadota bacterium]